MLKFHVLDVPDTVDAVNTLTRYVAPTFKPAPPGVVAALIDKVVVFVPLAHASELAFNVATVQELVPKSCSLGLSSIAVPILLNVMVGYADSAIKEYQTSADVVSPQNAEIPAVAVALTPASLKVPAVLAQVVPG